MIEMIWAAPMRWYLLALGALVSDQSSKWLISYLFSYGEVVAVMPFFNLTLVHNTGAAFSFLSDAGGWQRWVLSTLALAISCVLVVWLSRLPKNLTLLPLSLALILGGALGNLADRFMLGYVVDFIDWYYKGYHWPAFNLADAFICVGAVLLLIDSFRRPENENGAPTESKL